MKTIPHLSPLDFGTLPCDCNFVLRVEVEHNGDLYSANAVLLQKDMERTNGIAGVYAAQQICGKANVLISAGATAARAKLIRQSESEDTQKQKLGLMGTRLSEICEDITSGTTQ